MTTAARLYTRQQLIETRQLIPASDGIADDFGFTLPVAYSLAVWSDTIGLPASYAAPRDRAEREWRREWYLLLSLYDAIQQHRDDGCQPPARLDFEHYGLPGGHGFIDPRPVRLAAEKSPGDHGEQVITIMQPDQRVPWV